MISPTVGRKVWYFEHPGAPQQDATVIDVQGDRMVSLYVISRDGVPSVRQNTVLVQDDDAVPQGPHCGWMPYQTRQARKQDESWRPEEQKAEKSRFPFPRFGRRSSDDEEINESTDKPAG